MRNSEPVSVLILAHFGTFWHIFPHKPSLCQSSFVPSLHHFYRFSPCFSSFLLVFQHFPPFSPGFPRFSSPPQLFPGLPRAPRHLQGLAEESKRRIAATGATAWHQVLNVAKEATLQEVKQLGGSLDHWIVIDNNNKNQ